MASRRLSLRYVLVAVTLSLGAALATFHLKYLVRDLERELTRTTAQIERERWAVQAARADLAYLVRPSRLVMQAEQLGMVPARGGRLARIDQIAPWRQLVLAKEGLTATLPSGAAVPLRFRPLRIMTSLAAEAD